MRTLRTAQHWYTPWQHPVLAKPGLFDSISKSIAIILAFLEGLWLSEYWMPRRPWLSEYWMPRRPWLSEYWMQFASLVPDWCASGYSQQLSWWSELEHDPKDMMWVLYCLWIAVCMLQVYVRKVPCRQRWSCVVGMWWSCIDYYSSMQEYQSNRKQSGVLYCGGGRLTAIYLNHAK
jgi:hypothetical protein